MSAEAIVREALAVAGLPHLRDRLLSLDELAELPPARPLVDGLIYTNTVAQLAGPPGSYKSFIAIGLACALASGRPWCGHAVAGPRQVIYVAAEGGAGLHTRILAWCQHNRVPLQTVKARLRILVGDVQLGDGLDVQQVCDIAREREAALLVIDTRARCTRELAENDATAQGAAIHALDRIQQAADCAVLLLHHSGRNGRHGRGSNAWDGALWSDLQITKVNGICTIHCCKHKDVPDDCRHHYRAVSHLVPVALVPRMPRESDSQWQLRRSTLVVVRATIDDISEASPGRKDVKQPRAARVLLEVIRTTPGQTKSDIVALAVERGVGRTAAYEGIRALEHDRVIETVGEGVKAQYFETPARSSA